MASKIGKKEWIVVYAITGTIDLIQILIDLLFTEFAGAPEVVNEVIDDVVGIGLAVYFTLRGVSLIKKPARLASLLGMEFVTDITGGAASFWVLDAWYMHSSVKQEEAESQAQEEQAAFMQSNVRQPAYSMDSEGNSVRMPSSADQNEDSLPTNRHIAPAPSRMEQHPAPSRALNVGGTRRPSI
jgi:hypothetical protein